MDILYIVGTGSIWNNNELRYSLRSIERYGGNLGRIFIVGHKPDFVSEEVTFIPCADPYDMPHKNILHKVQTAIESGLLPEHFLLSSDDHFYIRQTDFAALPVYHKGMLPDIVPFGKETNPYFHSLLETRRLLERHGLTTYSTNPHCNTHFDVPTYRANKHIFDECFTLPHGGEMNCIMGNLLVQAGAEPVRFNDSKLGRDIRTDVAFTERVKDAECVSGVPRIGGSYLANWLIRNFHNKSRFEK